MFSFVNVSRVIGWEGRVLFCTSLHRLAGLWNDIKYIERDVKICSLQLCW